MMAIERRTLEALRLIATGKVTWSTGGGVHISFEYGELGTGEWRGVSELLRPLNESLYEREGFGTTDSIGRGRGRVLLTPNGDRLMFELGAIVDG